MAEFLPVGRSTCKAVSLLELLAVLAVIGFLSAMVFPAIQKARLSAASAHCVSNLKQLAAAHRMYEQDHEGKPPPQIYTSTHPESEGHSGVGIRLLRWSYRPGPRYVWSVDNKYIREPIELCPSVRINKLASNLENGPHYAIYSMEDKKYAQFYSKPSLRPLIWDGITSSWTPGSPQVPLRHNRGINCAFLDGHVEWISGEDDRLYHRWWYYACQSAEPDNRYLKDGNRMGVTQLP